MTTSSGHLTEPMGWSRFWRQQPGLLIAFAVFIVSVVVLAGAVLYWYLDSEIIHDDYLGAYESPRLILSSVQGVEGPAVEERGNIVLVGHRCVRRDVTVDLAITFHRDDGDATPVPYIAEPTAFGLRARTLTQSREKGCIDQTMLITLPAGVTAGTWHIEAIETAPISGEIVRWFSDPFVVVPKLAYRQ